MSRLPSTRRRALLAATAISATVGGLLMACLNAPAGTADTTLRSIAEAKGTYIGTEVTGNMIYNSTITNLAGAQFDMVTPGNEMKWDTTEPSNGSYNFGPGDNIVNFAKSKNMRVRGHNLVWHSQLPGWVSSTPLNQVQSVMESHITTEATHYKGQVYAWDVINEPFNEDGSLRADVFYNAMGTGYLADAIRTAHAADPNAKLYINDYNVEGLGAKSDGMYRLVSSLKQQGVPIDGVGFESHFILGQVPSSLKANMQRFTALGLDVAVTELDDRIQLPASSSALQQQANDYSYIVSTCLSVPGCVGVSQWGVGDADSWIPGTFGGYGAATMYDNNYQPKPAYGATATALSNGTGTTSTSTTTSTTTTTTTTTTTSTTTTTPPPPSGCKVSDVVNAWNTGLTENITITNTGSGTINNWSLAFTLPSGQSVVSAWNATITPNSGSVTATNLSYNGVLNPGASTTIGFQANQSGNAAAPTAFTLNGSPCTVS